MTNPNTIDEMNVTIIDVREVITQAMYVKDPIQKILLVQEALDKLNSFDCYWSETFLVEE